MASIKPSSRYANATFSSIDSSPSSSTDLTPQTHNQRNHHPSKISSRALTRPQAPSTTRHNLGSLVKKYVEHKSVSSSSKLNRKGELKVADFVAEDLKKTAKRGTGLSALHKKLFKGVKREEGSEKKKALIEVKGNTRTLAMVLRSERELLSMNKEQEDQIVELKLMLEEKNIEVEKLKDLCLKQREEIKSLKNSILFPDVMNSQLQEFLEKQGSELKQAKQLIPSLQRQVTSLTGQLQCLAVDLAEVKADKYSIRGCYDSLSSSPRTPDYDQEEAAYSLEFSSEPTIPGSPDDMLLKDLNPCLTPYSTKTKSEEFEFNSPDDKNLFKNNIQVYHETSYSCNSCTSKVSKSSECCQRSKAAKSSVRAARRSDESKYTYIKQIHNKF
ncbi:uncharacterized protein LOC107776998 [Nicotiana tabacum]|uniref:Uncharacterized protein LOC107776998 n=2 Tax=Nicotiana TaxID=4085 RepID=A0A1S3YK81_TOBAC|nr:PREDICTED: uncharacterized protein LOC104242516 [Nicotiana sylvestris]XP_016452448.1 PREDICTED: uncharacterized protein LOC107776998 [Nicotiana tabacum]